MHPTPALPYITAAAVALVLVLRLGAMRRARRLRLETLWVVPAVLAVALLGMIAEYPPRDGWTWARLLLALGLGGGVGWRRGRLMRIGIDPATHALNQQASPAAFLFVVLLLVARQGLRYEAAALGLNILQVTGILAAFAVGLVAATRAEMFVRARGLLRAARAQADGNSIGPTSAR